MQVEENGFLKYLFRITGLVGKIGQMYAKRYKSLLKQLNRFGLKRKSEETLATYAIQVDAHFGGDTMRELTNSYEKGIYGGDKEGHDWERLQELWEDLINRTSD